MKERSLKGENDETRKRASGGFCCVLSFFLFFSFCFCFQFGFGLLALETKAPKIEIHLSSTAFFQFLLNFFQTLHLSPNVT